MNWRGTRRPRPGLLFGVEAKRADQHRIWDGDSDQLRGGLVHRQPQVFYRVKIEIGAGDEGGRHQA